MNNEKYNIDKLTEFVLQRGKLPEYLKNYDIDIQERPV